VIGYRKLGRTLGRGCDQYISFPRSQNFLLPMQESLATLLNTLLSNAPKSSFATLIFTVARRRP
jgi:hypothetical protein